MHITNTSISTAVNSTSQTFHGIISNEFDPILIAACTILTALGLVLSHLIIITRYRLWHTNPILEKVPRLINNPLSHSLSTAAALVAVVPYNNDLYIVWLVILTIIYDNLQTVANYSLLEQGSDRLSREFFFIYNTCIIGSVLIIKSRDTKIPFFLPLLVLWSLLFLKFLERVVNYEVADRAYGIKNTNIVANYMEFQHKSGDHISEGYEYLVMGEDKKHCAVIEPPYYKIEFRKPEDFVTVKKVKDHMLNNNTDREVDKRPITDVCVAFALFKLIRRRFFGFRAIKSLTKNLVFSEFLYKEDKQNPSDIKENKVNLSNKKEEKNLPKKEREEDKTNPSDKKEDRENPSNYKEEEENLSKKEREEDVERLFRVIKMELGFLRDFFYTRYPIVFAYGFPIFNVTILTLMCATSIWISESAFNRIKHNSEGMHYWIVKGKNLDYRITNALLIVIIATEMSEVLSYVFSDWMKVIIICAQVRNKWVAKNIPFFYQMLGFILKPKFSVTLKNTIGQYRLLKSYKKGALKRHGINFLYHATCGMAISKNHRGANQDKAIHVPLEVKGAIYDVLRESKGHFANSMAHIIDKYSERIREQLVEQLSVEQKQVLVKQEQEQLLAKQKELLAKQEQLPTEREQLLAKQKELFAKQKELFAQREQLPADREQLHADLEQLLAKQEQLPAEQKQLLARKELPAEREQLLAKQKRLLDEQKRLLAEQEQLTAEQKQLHAKQERLSAEQKQLFAKQEQLFSQKSIGVTEKSMSRKNNGVTGLKWSMPSDNPLLAIMVWHIATSMCEIRPLKDGPVIVEDSCFTECSPYCLTKCFPKEKLNPQKNHQLVASSLSKYCAYLVVFAPKLLTTDVFLAHGIFDKIIEETSEYFTEINGPNELYERMITEDVKIGEEIKERVKNGNRVIGMDAKLERSFNSTDEEKGDQKKGNRVIDMGAKLGRYLIRINDDVARWKVMADFWSEMILYLAPHGQERHHLQKLASGGEFITHLWALLYHAGIYSKDIEDPDNINSGSENSKDSQDSYPSFQV